MQSKRVWGIVLVTGVAAIVTMLLTDRTNKSDDDPASQNFTVPEIGDRLATAGLGCGAVIRNEPPEPDDRDELAPSESALCSLGGTESLEGAPVHALILVYDSDKPGDGPSSAGPPDHAVIYGDRWEVWVPTRAAALAVADVLGGRLQLPNEFFDPSPTSPAE